MILERAGLIEFFLSNHGPETRELQVQWGRMRLDGTVLAERRRTVLAASSMTLRLDDEVRDLRGYGADECFFIRIPDQPTVTYFADGWKHIAWPRPAYELITFDAIEEGQEWKTYLKIRAKSFLRLFHLAPRKGKDAWLEDNYIDLAPGDTWRTKMTSTYEPAPEKLRYGDWTNWLEQ